MSHIEIEMPSIIPNAPILETASLIDNGGFHSSNERLVVLSGAWSEFCEVALLGSDICKKFKNEGELTPNLKAIVSYEEARRVIKQINKSLIPEDILISAKKAFDGIVTEEVVVEDALSARLLVKAFESRFIWNTQNQTL